MLKYKLTTQNNKTYNNTVWGENVTYTVSGKGELCTDGWLHYYHNPYLAVLMNPIHANIKNPKLWECEAKGVHKDDHGLKGGCTELTTLREVELPLVSMEQCIGFGIRCALVVCKEKKFITWANDWLNNADRSAAAAYDAAADAAADAAYATNAAYAAYAAYHAATTATAAATIAVAYAVYDAARVASMDGFLDIPAIINTVFNQR